jgi:hypothetical protein
MTLQEHKLLDVTRLALATGCKLTFTEKRGYQICGNGKPVSLPNIIGDLFQLDPTVTVYLADIPPVPAV